MTNFSQHEPCEFGPRYIVILTVIDIIPLLVGQRVIVNLLWITFTSKKTIDILNCNLALFHNMQYLVSIVHLSFLFSLPSVHKKILKFMLVYAQIGGPMSLSFISMERYVAVIHPTSYPLLKKRRFREVCAVTVWLFSVPFALISVLASQAFSSVREKVIKFIPIYMLVFTTVLMVWCSVSIARTLKKSGPGRDQLHPVKKRAFKTVCATSVLVLICYSPVPLIQKLNFVNEGTYDCILVVCCKCGASTVLPLCAGEVIYLLYLFKERRENLQALTGRKILEIHFLSLI